MCVEDYVRQSQTIQDRVYTFKWNSDSDTVFADFSLEMIAKNFYRPNTEPEYSGIIFLKYEKKRIGTKGTAQW